MMDAAFGDYSQKLNVVALMEKRGGANSASPEFAKLRGARFVHMEEPDESENSKLNHGLMKEWTGGSKITARPLYGKPITFRPMFKLCMACNTFPNIENEPATWRRIRAIEFISKFTSDPSLLSNPEQFPNHFPKDEGLREENVLLELAPAFMSLMVKYYKK